MNLGDNDVSSVGSSMISNAPWWDVDNGRGCARVRAGGHGKSLSLPLSFVVNLKLLSEILKNYF